MNRGKRADRLAQVQSQGSSPASDLPCVAAHGARPSERPRDVENADRGAEDRARVDEPLDTAGVTGIERSDTRR
jgi:hypothetical protein